MSRRARVTFCGQSEYKIVVEGHLDEKLSDRLGGMRITSTTRENTACVTTLIGRISDQAELNGIVNTLYDLHVPIISVHAVG